MMIFKSILVVFLILSVSTLAQEGTSMPDNTMLPTVIDGTSTQMTGSPSILSTVRPSLSPSVISNSDSTTTGPATVFDASGSTGEPTEATSIAATTAMPTASPTLVPTASPTVMTASTPRPSMPSVLSTQRPASSPDASSSTAGHASQPSSVSTVLPTDLDTSGTTGTTSEVPGTQSTQSSFSTERPATSPSVVDTSNTNNIPSQRPASRPTVIDASSTLGTGSPGFTLVAADSSCNQVDVIAYDGVLESVDQCVTEVFNNPAQCPSGVILFPPHPEWTCRCCGAAEGTDQLNGWNVYQVQMAQRPAAQPTVLDSSISTGTSGATGMPITPSVVSTQRPATSPSVLDGSSATETGMPSSTRPSSSFSTVVPTMVVSQRPSRLLNPTAVPTTMGTEIPSEQGTSGPVFTFTPTMFVTQIPSEQVVPTTQEPGLVSTSTAMSTQAPDLPTSQPVYTGPYQGWCANENSVDVDDGEAYNGAMPRVLCELMCSTNDQCTAYQYNGQGPTGSCYIHTSTAVVSGTGNSGGACYVKLSTAQRPAAEPTALDSSSSTGTSGATGMPITPSAVSTQRPATSPSVLGFQPTVIPTMFVTQIPSEQVVPTMQGPDLVSKPTAMSTQVPDLPTSQPGVTVCGCVAQYGLCESECSEYFSVVTDAACQNVMADLVCVEGVPDSFFGTPYNLYCPNECPIATGTPSTPSAFGTERPATSPTVLNGSSGTEASMPSSNRLPSGSPTTRRGGLLDSTTSTPMVSQRPSRLLNPTAVPTMQGPDLSTFQPGSNGPDLDLKPTVMSTQVPDLDTGDSFFSEVDFPTVCECVAQYGLCESDCSKYFSTVTDGACQNAIANLVCVEGVPDSFFGTPYYVYCESECPVGTGLDEFSTMDVPKDFSFPSTDSQVWDQLSKFDLTDMSYSEIMDLVQESNFDGSDFSEFMEELSESKLDVSDMTYSEFMDLVQESNFDGSDFSEFLEELSESKLDLTSMSYSEFMDLAQESNFDGSDFSEFLEELSESKLDLTGLTYSEFMDLVEESNFDASDFSELMDSSDFNMPESWGETLDEETATLTTDTVFVEPTTILETETGSNTETMEPEIDEPTNNFHGTKGETYTDSAHMLALFTTLGLLLVAV